MDDCLEPTHRACPLELANGSAGSWPRTAIQRGQRGHGRQVPSYDRQMLTPSTIGEDLADFFRASQVSTAIISAATVDLAERAEFAQQRLDQARFDQAPVMHKGRPVGWVAAKALTRGSSVQEVMTALEDCTLVSAEASIAAILQLLLDEQFIFTVSKESVSGFIVHSDIDRHAVRSYLYLLVSGIEMLLAEIIKSAIPEGRIATRIRADLQDAYSQARAENRETSAAEYLYIGELVDLFTETSYARNADLWDADSRHLLIQIRNFRNSVMHPVRSIAAAHNIETAAHLPGWASAVTDRLRSIIMLLDRNS
jgi:hypothetical protein